MKKLIFPLIGLTFATACQKEVFIPKPEPGEGVNYADHPRHETYSSQLEHYQMETNAPGAILLVQRTGEPLWVGAVGKSNLEHQSPMRTNSPFRIGSITKLFVATAVMQLVEQEKLQLDAPAIKWLPKLQEQIPGIEQVSIRHLLAHQSGIFDPTNESTRYKLDLVDAPEKIAAMEVDDLLQAYVYGKALHFTPGSDYAYSNVNYWLLGQIVASVTGKSLQAALQERIFSPLSLQNTYLEKRDDRNVARGYADVYGDGTLLDVTHWERAEVDGNAAGGIVSTATELMVFMEALMQGQIVSMSSVEEMKRIQLSNCDHPDCESGIGLELWRTGAGIGYGKNGSIAGTEANMVYYPENGNMFVLYKNNGNGSDKSFLDQIMK